MELVLAGAASGVVEAAAVEVVVLVGKTVAVVLVVVVAVAKLKVGRPALAGVDIAVVRAFELG